MVFHDEKWRKNLNEGKVPLLDLLKKFDTIHHSLIIAKIEAYGLSRPTLTCSKIYLDNQQGRKISIITLDLGKHISDAYHKISSC